MSKARTLANFVSAGNPLSDGTIAASDIAGLGTGVATALAVNVGSAGAPVVNGGALGTPSGGTLTSATGLPIGTGVSGLGTGVATALAVNVGSAGAAVVNGGPLGTPSSGTLTSATGLPLSTGVTGTLPIGNGGTGATSLSGITVGTATTATTATNLAGGTNGSIPYQSASGITQMLAAGTAGQVLQSNGAAAPTFVTPSAGAMTLISTSTFSAASQVDFTDVTGYSNYRIIIRNLTYATASTLELRFGRPNIVTSSYGFSQIYLDSVAIQMSFANNNSTRIYLISSVISTNPDYGVAGSIDIFNFGVGGLPKVMSNLGYFTGSAWTFYQTWGFLADTTPASVIRLFSSGSTISGTISLYGISS